MGPTAVRTSRRTGAPTASSSRRTSRLRPSTRTTSTKDLRSAFPALAARELGLGDVPLLCAGELDVVGGNPNTIRVLLHCYSTRPRASLRHVYLHHAKHLRDDLSE